MVLQVSYSPEVGKEHWYFYIHPETFELKAYQFYHNEEENDGEYILLEELIEFEGLKIPKTRIWFMNKDDKQIGKDVIRGSATEEIGEVSTALTSRWPTETAAFKK